MHRVGVQAVQAVCFDLYETLISEYSQGVRKVSRASRDYETLVGLSNDLFKKEWNARSRQRMSGVFADYPSVLRDILGTYQLHADDLIIEQLYQERVLEKRVPFEEIRDDMVTLLGRLKEKDIKLGLISNCTEEEVQAWSGSKLAPYFDEVLFSYQTGYSKPDAAIYELAAARLGVAAAQCAFVGDGGSNELDGATAAGMKAYHAIWYLPESISSRITAYTKLERPHQLLEELRLTE